MWLSRAALKLFTDLAFTTVVGSKFQVVAVLLAKNLFLPMLSLQIYLTIWDVCDLSTLFPLLNPIFTSSSPFTNLHICIKSPLLGQLSKSVIPKILRRS